MRALELLLPIGYRACQECVEMYSGYIDRIESGGRIDLVYVGTPSPGERALRHFFDDYQDLKDAGTVRIIPTK